MFGIPDILSGLYGIHYQHELGELVSIQVGGGLTGHNYAQGWLPGFLDYMPNSETSNNNPTNGTDIKDDYWDFGHRTSNLGYFIAIQPKFFISEDGFDGWYFGINFQFRHYNFMADNIDTTIIYPNNYNIQFGDIKYISVNPIAEYENQMIYAISYGLQWTGEKTFVDESVSIGIRNMTGQRRDFWQITNIDASGNRISHPVALINNVNKSQVYFDFTVKIGFWWGNKSK